MSQDDQANVIGKLVMARNERLERLAAVTTKLKQTGLDLYPVTEGLRQLDPTKAKEVQQAFNRSHWLTAELPQILETVKEYITLVEQLDEDAKTLKQFNL